MYQRSYLLSTEFELDFTWQKFNMYQGDFVTA